MTLKLQNDELIYLSMAGLFLTCLIVANLMGSLLFSFTAPWGGPVLLSSGILAFPVTFILTDLLNEFYGRRGAQVVTVLGFAMSIVMFLFFWLGGQLPVDEKTALPLDVYQTFTGQYTGMFVASLTAYLVGQFLDIYIFEVFRRLTGGKLIWLRATGSTVVSQLFDSFIVCFIAFSGTLAVEDMWSIATSNYIWKFIIAVGITPLIYLGRMIVSRFLNPRQRQEAFVLEEGVSAMTAPDGGTP